VSDFCGSSIYSLKKDFVQNLLVSKILTFSVESLFIFSCRVTQCLVVSVCLSVRLSVCLSQIFVPNFCPKFLNEALQLLLDLCLFFLHLGIPVIYARWKREIYLQNFLRIDLSHMARQRSV
jgi:hypothetical protein